MNSAVNLHSILAKYFITIVAVRRRVDTGASKADPAEVDPPETNTVTSRPRNICRGCGVDVGLIEPSQKDSATSILVYEG